MDDLFSQKRLSATAEKRQEFVGEVLSECVSIYGRQWAREKVKQWWRLDDLIEEEREAIVSLLASNGTTDILYFRSLGTLAEEMALRVFDKNAASITGSRGRLRLAGAQRRKSRTATLTARRVETLLTPVNLDIDVRDACLEGDELSSRLLKKSHWNSFSL
jgi:hypothetical protein